MEIKLTKKQEEILTNTSNDSSKLLAAYQMAEQRRKEALELVCDAHGIQVPKRGIIKDGLFIIEEE